MTLVSYSNLEHSIGTVLAEDQLFLAEVLDLTGIDNPKLEIDVTNHRGIRGTRIVKPLRRAMWFGSTPHHPEPQWFMHAWDIEKEDERDFAWKSIHSIRIIKEEVQGDVQGEKS